MTKEEQKEIDIKKAINVIKDNVNGKGYGIIIIKITNGQISDLEVTEKIHYGIDKNW